MKRMMGIGNQIRNPERTWKAQLALNEMLKNPHAVALGKLGGKKRAQKLTPQRRLEISQRANKIKSSKLK